MLNDRDPRFFTPSVGSTVLLRLFKSRIQFENELAEGSGVFAVAKAATSSSVPSDQAPRAVPSDQAPRVANAATRQVVSSDSDRGLRKRPPADPGCVIARWQISRATTSGSIDSSPWVDVDSSARKSAAYVSIVSNPLSQSPSEPRMRKCSEAESSVATLTSGAIFTPDHVPLEIWCDDSRTPRFGCRRAPLKPRAVVPSIRIR